MDRTRITPSAVSARPILMKMKCRPMEKVMAGTRAGSRSRPSSRFLPGNERKDSTCAGRMVMARVTATVARE